MVRAWFPLKFSFVKNVRVFGSVHEVKKMSNGTIRWKALWRKACGHYSPNVLGFLKKIWTFKKVSDPKNVQKKTPLLLSYKFIYLYIWTFFLDVDGASVGAGLR
jgi:hypothetical protein